MILNVFAVLLIFSGFLLVFGVLVFILALRYFSYCVNASLLEEKVILEKYFKIKFIK